MGRGRDDSQRGEAEKLVRTEVRFTAEANEALDEIAKENGISKAELIRYIVDNRMNDYLGSIKFIDPEQGDEIRRDIMRVMNELTAVKTELRRIGVNYNQEIKNQNYILKRGGTIATGSSRLNQALLDRAIKQVELDTGQYTKDKTTQNERRKRQENERIREENKSLPPEKQKPLKYIWKDDLKERILKAAKSVRNYPDFFNELREHGVEAEVRTKRGGEQYIVYEFVG